MLGHPGRIDEIAAMNAKGRKGEDAEKFHAMRSDSRRMLASQFFASLCVLCGNPIPTSPRRLQAAGTKCLRRIAPARISFRHRRRAEPADDPAPRR